MKDSVIDYDAPEPTPDDFVQMAHPELAPNHVDRGGAAAVSVTRQAFDEVWEEKGWEIVNDASVAEVPTVVPVNGEQAAAMGVDPAEVMTTETAPSELAVDGEENPTDDQAAASSTKDSPKEKK